MMSLVMLINILITRYQTETVLELIDDNKNTWTQKAD